MPGKIKLKSKKLLKPSNWGIVFKSKSSAKNFYKKARKIDAKRARSTFFPEAITKNENGEYVLPFVRKK